MSNEGLYTEIAGGALDLISPATYMSAYGNRAAREEQERQAKIAERLERDKFDLAEKLSMQDYREKERQRKWKSDFARALSL